MQSTLWRKWARKFALAGRGVLYGMQDQNSFYVHLPVAALVIIVAATLKCELWQWCILLLCIGLVLAAELANSALEELAAALCQQHNAGVGRALDIASGAVLIVSLTAACVGVLIFIYQLISNSIVLAP